MNYDKLPAHMQEAARGYVEDGAVVGGFLTALLSNNLFETYEKPTVPIEKLFQFGLIFCTGKHLHNVGEV